MLPYHTDHDSVRFVLKVDGIFPHVWEYIDEIFCNIPFYDLRRIKEKKPDIESVPNDPPQTPLPTTSCEQLLHTRVQQGSSQAPSRHLPLSHFLTDSSEAAPPLGEETTPKSSKPTEMPNNLAVTSL